MNIARTIAAWLLALPLIIFGGNYFVQAFALPEGAGGPGDQLLKLMYDGGLMAWVALSHVAIGMMLLVPRLRFAGGLLQLPISLGILAFHMTILPEGNGVALIMVTLNVIVLADGTRMRALTH